MRESNTICVLKESTPPNIYIQPWLNSRRLQHLITVRKAADRSFQQNNKFKDLAFSERAISWFRISHEIIEKNVRYWRFVV
jgi:hypothetical protein